MMTPATQATSMEFVDAVSGSILAALDTLFQHENALAEISSPSSAERAWTNSLAKLEATVGGWQAILDEMGEQVRTEHESLAVLDTDLNRSLAAFAAARKHLQGQANEADRVPKA
jgi:hypothetical protein